jgi:hypothetical protein
VVAVAVAVVAVVDAENDVVVACTFVVVVVGAEDIVNVEGDENIAEYDLVVDDNVVHYLIMDLMVLHHERQGILRSMQSREMGRTTLSVEPNY